MQLSSRFSRWQQLLPKRSAQLWYAPIAALAMALLFVRLLVYAAWLDVGQFAVLSASLLVSGLVGMLACFGLQPLVQREFPVLAVRGRNRAAMVRLSQAALAACLIVVLALAITLTGARWPGLSSPAAAWALLHGLTQQIFLLYTVESRSHGQAMLFAWQSLARALLMVLAGCVTSFATKDAIWTIVAEAGACLAVMACLTPALVRRNGIRPLITVRLAFKRLPTVPWTAATLLLATGALAYLLSNADRWVANSQLDAAGFAIYAFAWITLLAASQAQVIVNSAAFPWLARRFASHGLASAFGSTVALSGLMLVASVAIVFPALWLATWAIPRYWPHLASSVVLLPLFAVCAALRLSDFWSSFLIVSGHERRLLTSGLLAGLVAAAAWWSWFEHRPRTIAPLDVAWLAAGLTLATYLASMLTAMRVKRALTC